MREVRSMKSLSMRIAIIGYGESGGNFAARLAAGEADGSANMQCQTREEAKRRDREGGSVAAKLPGVVRTRSDRRCQNSKSCSRPFAACRAPWERTFNDLHNRLATKRSDVVDGSDTRMDHRITSSACRRIDSGMVNPRALAVFRLITSSNFVGCSIGRSPGLAPLRILSTYLADRRNKSPKFGP